MDSDSAPLHHDAQFPKSISARASRTKRSWQAPTVEEIDYSSTEAAGAPGAFYDGFGAYSFV